MPSGRETGWPIYPYIFYAKNCSTSRYRDGDLFIYFISILFGMPSQYRFTFCCFLILVLNIFHCLPQLQCEVRTIFKHRCNHKLTKLDGNTKQY